MPTYEVIISLITLCSYEIKLRVFNWLKKDLELKPVKEKPQDPIQKLVEKALKRNQINNAKKR